MVTILLQDCGLTPGKSPYRTFGFGRIPLFRLPRLSGTVAHRRPSEVSVEGVKAD